MPTMLACVDADYREEETVAACLLFEGFSSEGPVAERVAYLPAAAPYQPGQFYLRELPALRQVLEPVLVGVELAAVLIDGYVWLSGELRPGLGAHLYEALGRRAPVVGVAKNPFRPVPETLAVPVRRGQSQRPLFVSAVGLELAGAVEGVRAMHGPHRIPTLLQRVDHLCRRAPPKGQSGPMGG